MSLLLAVIDWNNDGGRITEAVVMGEPSVVDMLELFPDVCIFLSLTAKL